MVAVMVAAAALPARALPPDADPPDSAQEPVSCAADPQPRPGLAKKSGSCASFWAFLLLLFAGQSALLGDAAQGPANPAPGPLPPALPSWNATGDLVLQSINLALGRANASGVLPPLEDLTARLSQNSFPNFSSMAPLSSPAGLALNPLLAGSVPFNNWNISADTAMLAALDSLNAAQLQAAGRILQGVGHQLLADASLASDNKTVAQALAFAGDNLLSMGDFFEAAAALAEAEADLQIIRGLPGKEAGLRSQEEYLKTLADGGLHPSEKAPPPDPFALALMVNPGIIYGTWQRVENSPSNQLIMYKVSREEVVKLNVTTVDKQKRIHTESYPGPVTCEVAYTIPEDADSFDQAIGPVLVTMLINNPQGKVMTFPFSYLRAKGTAVGAGTELDVDVLIEREGEKKAFFRISQI